jgi:hypothetical protein
MFLLLQVPSSILDDLWSSQMFIILNQINQIEEIIQSLYCKKSMQNLPSNPYDLRLANQTIHSLFLEAFFHDITHQTML